ncbi:DUF4328 domain-containing protein [Amycolatopsis sp.]|uniref:DUF4328 domain-containing protein n=1 Tax=Amycolatopsis sp. TaxID=37632 RepID=UPI002C5AC909|nr:DUF4328 domain-containing protein [Amycolatopsis sp.]HVV13638.1 DUF4328 domain-containing protein [Amycolatopsis sp.]
MPDPENADSITNVCGRLRTVLTLIAAPAFLPWLYRARTSAGALSPAQHRHGRGSVIGGWFCPIVNFFFPWHIVISALLSGDDLTMDRLRDSASLLAVASVGKLAAAVLVLLIIKRIDDWKRAPRQPAVPALRGTLPVPGKSIVDAGTCWRAPGACARLCVCVRRCTSSPGVRPPSWRWPARTMPAASPTPS